MKHAIATLRRNPVTAIMVVLGLAVAYNFLADTSNVSQSDLNKQKRRIDRIVKVIHVPEGVDVSNGNHSPSGQPGPAGDGGAPGNGGSNGSPPTSGGGGGGSTAPAPTPTPATHPPVNVTTPQLPVVGTPTVCVGPLGVNC